MSILRQLDWQLFLGKPILFITYVTYFQILNISSHFVLLLLKDICEVHPGFLALHSWPMISTLCVATVISNQLSQCELFKTCLSVWILHPMEVSCQLPTLPSLLSMKWLPVITGLENGWASDLFWLWYRRANPCI
jgi:hypothetical protein